MEDAGCNRSPQRVIDKSKKEILADMCASFQARDAGLVQSLAFDQSDSRTSIATSVRVPTLVASSALPPSHTAVRRYDDWRKAAMVARAYFFAPG